MVLINSAAFGGILIYSQTISVKYSMLYWQETVIII